MNCFTAKNPEEHDYTLTLTMQLSDWRILRKQLKGDKPYASWPASTVTSQIDDMVTQAEKTYWPDPALDRQSEK